MAKYNDNGLYRPSDFNRYQHHSTAIDLVINLVTIGQKMFDPLYCHLEKLFLGVFILFLIFNKFLVFCFYKINKDLKDSFMFYFCQFQILITRILVNKSGYLILFLSLIVLIFNHFILKPI